MIWNPLIVGGEQIQAILSKDRRSGALIPFGTSMVSEANGCGGRDVMAAG